MKFTTKIGREYTVPSKKQKDYLYNTATQKYEPTEVETIDFNTFDVIEGDGSADYRSNSLLDLLRKQKMLISDMIMHVSLMRAEKIRDVSKLKDTAATARAEETKRLYCEGWNHNEKGTIVTKASATSIDKLVDGAAVVCEAKAKCHTLQGEIDKMTARKEQLEREYFNCDDSIKTLSRIMGVSF